MVPPYVDKPLHLGIFIALILFCAYNFNSQMWVNKKAGEIIIQTHCQKIKKIKRADKILPEVYATISTDLL
jgi:hypothetical protein